MLITTRDTTFSDARFGPSKWCAHIELGGLARQDALALAAAVLDDHGIDRGAIDREELLKLMDQLGGHPLSLNLVLPHLRDHTPAELSARFEALLPGFTAGAAKERNESLAVSLEFSLNRLGAETRAALPDLAVFQGGAFEDDLLEIIEMDSELWRVTRVEMEQAALVTAESLPNVRFPFLRFHPTLLPYLADQLSPARRAELEERYWKRYYAVANYLYQSDTQHPHEARAIALRELPNLRSALDLAVAAGEVEAAVKFADSIAMFLDYFGRWRERDAMMGQISNLKSQISSEEGLTKAEYLMLTQQGDAKLQQGRAAEAERVFRGLLERMEAGMVYSGDEADYDHATTLWGLGRCLEAQGRPAEAIEWHRRALEEFEGLEPTRAVKKMEGAVHTELADLNAALGRFDAAEDEYRAALAVDEQLGDDRGKGVDLGQLGTLAMMRGDLGEAARRHAEALETFRALGEPQMEAVAWHQLGMVAEEARDWDEAERCYRESLRLEEQMNHAEGVAQTCNQLAIVAEGAGRPDDAERWYLRAQELKDQVSPHDAITLSNLADLYLSQGRLDEAARYARRAVEIKETLDLSAEPWKIYSILAQIAEAQGRADKAAGWRRKEQESFAAYARAAHEIREWLPVIQMVVAACEGDASAAEQVDALLQQLEEGWPTTVAAVRQILDGERDIEVLRGGLLRKAYVVVHTILAQLAGAAQTPGVPETSGVSETPGVSEVSDAVARLRQQWGPVVRAVVAACGGDAGAGAQVGPFLEQLSAQDDWRELAATLRRVLAGERDPRALLAGLDPTDTLVVADVLRALGVAGLPEL